MNFKEYLEDRQDVNEASSEKELDEKVYKGMRKAASDLQTMIDEVSSLIPDAKLIDSEKYNKLKEAEKELIRIRTNLNKAKMRGYK